MSSTTLEKPKVKKEEKILIHSEAKLFTQEFPYGNAHVIRTKYPYYPDDPNDPDELVVSSPSYRDSDWNYVVAEQFNYDHSLFRFFRPGTVMNIDPYFQYIVQKNFMSHKDDIRNENVVTAGQLAQIVDNDLGKVLLQSDFQWVLQFDHVLYNTNLESGVYMSHKRNQKNGDVIRVVDFIYNEKKFAYFKDDGELVEYPSTLCNDFFFKPKKNKAALKNVDFFVQDPEYWGNYDDGWNNQYLDLKIKDKGVKYELNIPSGYSADLIPVTGKISIPNTKTRQGEDFEKNKIILLSYDNHHAQKLQFQTVSDGVHLTLLLSKGKPY